MKAAVYSILAGAALVAAACAPLTKTTSDERAAHHPAGQAVQAAPAAPDYAAELEQLAQLKAQGILTDEEFEAKKKQILGI